MRSSSYSDNNTHKMRLLRCVIWLGITVQCFDAISVEIEQGTLKGSEIELLTKDGTYFSFKGIPYAQPPIGDLRFRAPQSPTSWVGIRNATEHGSKCYHFDVFTGNFTGGEDCLFINVYTPPNLNPIVKYPVMVFIHGGAWSFGSGDSDFYSPDFLIPHQVILVTMNYRLEVLGFLSLQNKEVPGNNGLKDQVAALRWVKNNIARFGGDFDNITIYGQSTGGMSVSYHLISPMSTNLFNRAIISSGSILQDSATVTYPRERAFLLGQSLGLTTTDDKALLKFLKKTPVELLAKKFLPLTGWESLTNFGKLISFAPVVETVSGNEERFLDKPVEEYLKQGKLPNDVDILMGRVNGEGVFIYSQFYTQYDIMNQYNDYFLTKKMAYATTHDQGLQIGKKIRAKYLGENLVSNTTTSNELISRYFGWSAFNYDIQKYLNYISFMKSKRYFYYFTAETERIYVKRILGPPTPTASTCHADDLLYLFGVPIANIPLNTSSTSYSIIQEITLLWTNFAKYGNPTPDGNGSGLTWKPWTASSQDYIEISNEGFIPKQRLETEEYKFWDDIYSEISANEQNITTKTLLQKLIGSTFSAMN